MKRLAVLGALLVALTLAGLALHVPGHISVGPPERKEIFVGLLALAAVGYFAAIRVILRGALPARTVWLVLIVAAAMRLSVLFAPPFLSNDVNRYVWDGWVQSAGINPYRYVPADPALAGLRDEAVYPFINRAATAPTIYPPTAQLIFGAIGRVAPTVLGVKSVMVGFEALSVVCLLRLLSLARLPRERVLIHAWNPLVVWAFAGNGHVDAAAVALLAAAMLLRVLRRDALAGALFGAAVLVKFLPAIVAPALWRARAGWRFAAAAALAVVCLYACYLGAGWRVLGFLPGYPADEGLADGTGLWLLAGIGTVTHLPSIAAPIYAAATATGLAVLGAWIAFRRRATAGSPEDVVAVCAGAAMLMAFVTVAISPHYPWYFAWLALPCVVWPNAVVLWLSAAPVLLYVDPFNERFFWPSLVYVPALLLALAELRRPRLPSRAVAPPATEGNA